ncbi:MAG: transposase [Myxococcota bacterium]
MKEEASPRLPASERTSQRIAELRERLGEGDGINELMRLGVRELVERALEEEVEDALGRGYCARGGEQRGYRNGHRTGRISTAEGEVEF